MKISIYNHQQQTYKLNKMVVVSHEFRQHHRELTKAQRKKRFARAQFLAWFYHALMIALAVIAIVVGACYDLGTLSGAFAATPSRLWGYYALNLSLGVGTGLGFIHCFVASMFLDNRPLGSASS